MDRADAAESVEPPIGMAKGMLNTTGFSIVAAVGVVVIGGGIGSCGGSDLSKMVFFVRLLLLLHMNDRMGKFTLPYHTIRGRR